jgi:hypothetical protein
MLVFLISRLLVLLLRTFALWRNTLTGSTHSFSYPVVGIDGGSMCVRALPTHHLKQQRKTLLHVHEEIDKERLGFGTP